MQNNLLSRLVVFNLAGLAIVAFGWMRGYASMVTAADPFHMSYVIGGVFLAGLALTFWRASRIARMPAVGTITSIYARIHAKKKARKEGIRNLAIGDVIESLAMLGLIGSALGLLYAFGGIDKAALTSLDGIKAAAGNVLTGVSTLAGATFTGMAMALWTIWNNRMLETATALYLEDFE
jgi:hypothetical protein